MRLTFEALGWTWDWSLLPTATDDETGFEAYQDAGTVASTAMTAEHNGWERVATMYDEPSEGDEDRRTGFVRR